MNVEIEASCDTPLIRHNVKYPIQDFTNPSKVLVMEKQPERLPVWTRNAAGLIPSVIRDPWKNKSTPLTPFELLCCLFQIWPSSELKFSQFGRKHEAMTSSDLVQLLVYWRVDPFRQTLHWPAALWTTQQRVFNPFQTPVNSFCVC